MQLKYPFFDDGISESDFRIDMVASRGAATNGVLKEFIFILDVQLFPRKMFRAHMRMCNYVIPARAFLVLGLRPLATSLQGSNAASKIMAMTSRKKRCHCNICDVGFDFPSKLQRHFTSSRHKMLEERYSALTTSPTSMPWRHEVATLGISILIACITVTLDKSCK